MDELTISELGKVFVVAFFVAIVTQVIKVSALKQWKESEYYSLVLNVISVCIAFFLTFVAQRISWIAQGWEYTIFAGIFVMGLAILQYEAVQGIWLAITGKNINNITIGNVTNSEAIAVGTDSEATND